MKAAIETCNESNDRRDYLSVAPHGMEGMQRPGRIEEVSGSGDLVCCWNGKAEPAAHAHRTLHVKRAPMRLHDTARDREAQSGTVLVGAVALLPIPVEDMRQVLSRDALPGILHSKAYPDLI